jgi:hypothetical protein
VATEIAAGGCRVAEAEIIVAALENGDFIGRGQADSDVVLRTESRSVGLTDLLPFHPGTDAGAAVCLAAAGIANLQAAIGVWLRPLRLLLALLALLPRLYDVSPRRNSESNPRPREPTEEVATGGQIRHGIGPLTNMMLAHEVSS